MEGARVPTSEQLMAEMAWVKKLARAMVKNDALADDIAQETWLVATEQQPDVDRPLRPWLGRVVTNLVRTRRRSDARREKRDAAIAVDRSVPTPDELIERVELQRALTEELLALAEPYRSTVMLHFVEGFSCAEIARQLGIPDGTVRRRLKVALDQLREALRKRRDQPRHGWLAALVPFARLPDLPSATTKVSIMNKLISIVVVSAVALAIVVGAVWHHNLGARPIAARPVAAPVPRATRDLAPRSAIPIWKIQAGAPDRRIAGRVVFRGIPIAGAKVELGLDVIGEMNVAMVLPESLSRVIQPIAEQTSAADGTFDFGVQPAAEFTVSAAAPNFGAGAAAVANADPHTPSSQLVVELGACQTRLSGVVADASGGPIARARISISGVSGTESDPTGKYSLCVAPRQGGLGSPANNIRVEADGYGTIRQDILVSGDLRLDFKLAPEAVLVGRVTSGGQPVGGVRVIATPAPSLNAMRFASGWATTDADGKFRIAGLSPAEFNLVASAQDLGTSAPLSVVARPAATSRELAVVVEQLAHILGRVTLDGTPVAGAKVAALHDGTPTGVAISQQDGTFAIGGVRYGEVTLTVLGYRVEDAARLAVDRAVVDAPPLAVAKLATVHGHVLRHGAPVAGANVVVMTAPQASWIGAPPVTRADASGAYVIEGMPAGPGTVVAWESSTTKAFSAGFPVNLELGEDKEVDVVLAFGGEVKGRVVDQSGGAVVNAYVWLDDGRGDRCQATADASGQFDCFLLAGGSYQPFVAPAPGGQQAFGPELAHIEVPRDGVVTGVKLVVRDDRTAISGTIVDDAGTPVADVQIAALGPTPLPTMGPPTTMSDRDGHFELGDLARGTYRVQALAADGGETMVQNIVAGGPPITVKLARSGAVDGTLIGFASTPDVFALANRPGGQLKPVMVTGDRFSGIGLAAGQYTIHAQAGPQVDSQTVEVRSGETASITLHSRATAIVEGTVTDFASHTPLAGLRCDAQLLAPGQTISLLPDVAQQAYTDALGHFSVNAPLGRVRVFCFAVNGELRSPAGGDVDVTASGAKLSAASVRGTDEPPAKIPGLVIDPLALPVTIAAASGALHPGDQIVSVDGVSVEGLLPDGVAMLIGNHRVATLVVSRAGALLTIKLP